MTDHAAVARHWCDLDKLKAEVEARRVAVRVEVARIQNRAGGYDELDDDEDQIAMGAGQVLAYTRVLDLIDKHAREGQ